HEKTVFSQEARQIFQTVRHAREISLLERKDVVFRVDEEGNAYWLEYAGGGGKAHPLPQGLLIIGKDVVFFPKGNSTGGTIRIQNGRGQDNTIEIDPILGTPKFRRF
ncbi:MAG: hypothetical protein HZA17_03990, partial [Nitrospirae bacterium]|nr:hypothetical protein [Nitrospirota bacterium]